MTIISAFLTGTGEKNPGSDKSQVGQCSSSPLINIGSLNVSILRTTLCPKGPSVPHQALEFTNLNQNQIPMGIILVSRAQSQVFTVEVGSSQTCQCDGDTAIK